MRILISALLTCGFALAAHAQQPPAKKESKPSPKLADLPLEELLARALKDNPDIRAAEAKVRESEAELNRTRLAAMQKLTEAYHNLAARKATANEANLRYKRASALLQSKAIGVEEYGLAKLTLSKAEADLAALEAQLPYLIGKNQTVPFIADDAMFWLHTRVPDTVRLWDTQAFANTTQPRGTLAEKVRKVLDTPITGEWKDTPVQEIVNYFGAKFQAEQINFFNDRVSHTYAVGVPTEHGKKGRLEHRPLTTTMLIKHPLPLAAALQYLEDLMDKRGRFVIREYGIVLADPGSLPPGAVFVIDFWKSKPEKTPDSGSAR